MVIVAHKRLMPKPLQPVGERIEQVGERHSENERQQDVAEHPEEEEQEGEERPSQKRTWPRRFMRRPR